MKKLSLSVTIIFLIGIFISNSYSQETEPLTDVLTLDFTFGDENLPDEFLLARPTGIVVLNNGDILVTDENRMKIFTSNGKSKNILGREGYGPGEFKNNGRPYLSYEGFLAVFAGQLMYNFYDSDLNAVRKINYSQYEGYERVKKKYNMHFGLIDKLILADIDSYIYIISGAGFQNRKNANLVVSKIEDKTIVLGENEIYQQALGGNFGLPVFYQDKFKLEQLSIGKVVFSGGINHRFENDGFHFYTIKITDYNGDNIIEIHREYKRLDIPESHFDKYRGSSKKDGREAAAKQMIKILKEHPYYPPLRDLRVDGNYIFAFTYSKNDHEEILTDIFDGSTGKYLRQAYFSVIPRYIKDGKAYFLKRGQDIFPKVEVYSIDPSVYER